MKVLHTPRSITLQPLFPTIQRNFQCDFMLVNEDEKQVSLIVELPEINVDSALLDVLAGVVVASLDKG